MSLTVMGIDCSTTGVAFSVIDDGKLVKWGKVDFNGKGVFERLINGQKYVTSIRDEFDVDALFFESAIFVQNKRTVVLMAMALGAIVPSIIKPGVFVDDIAPIVWNNAIGNKAFTKAEKQAIENEFPGKSKSWYQSKQRAIRKNRTRRWVLDKFGVDIEIDDVTDAIAIGYVGWEKLKNEQV